MTKKVVRIALLICDTPVQKVVDEFGDYHAIFRTWLQDALATYPDQRIAKNTELILDGYNVVDKREYPARERLIAGAREGYDAVMLTGSKHTAHDPSETFVPPLVDFVRSIISDPETQHLQVLGICFGHQIISMALGGQCVRGTNGWEIGVYGVDLTKEGKYWWCGDVSGEGGEERIYVQQLHRDHVPTLPPGCTLLASTQSYPVHSYVKLHPSSTPTNPIAHILTVQGHPEFVPTMMRYVVEVRATAGIFDQQVASEALRRAGGKDGTGGEGLGRVGWAFWRVLLQDPPLQPIPRVGVDGDVEMAETGPIPNGIAHSNGRANGTNGESSTRAYLADRGRYDAVDRVLDRRGPWTDEQFVGGSEAKAFLREKAKILVIGAGGLGCEILQNLALTGFTDIHVIDMDTIDISNLNRQFLFRESDVGKSKALVAAEFIMSRVPGVKVTPYHGKIQDHPEEFYMQFAIIIAGLDSISARRWINATLVNMVDDENDESLKPLIDGGTEGFKGQARVILPTITSCYECSIDMLTPPTVFPVCTIANTPRLPEHCIEWASVLEWPKMFKDKKLDTDDPDHIEWLYQQATTRAKMFKIEGVTWALTQGVVKNIIPAIASTNAIIAASCCNEAFKIATTCAPSLNNYMMYTGNSSIYTYTFEHGKRDECPVCGGEAAIVRIGKDWTLERLVEHLKEAQEFKLSRPSLSSESGPLFWYDPPAIYESTKGNLDKLVVDLLPDGGVLSVTDKALPAANLSVEVQFD